MNPNTPGPELNQRTQFRQQRRDETPAGVG